MLGFERYTFKDFWHELDASKDTLFLKFFFYMTTVNL